MAVQYTSIGPINSRYTFHNDGGSTVTIQGQIVAFGWDDAEPETVTGFWVHSPDLKPPGLHFFPAAGITDVERVN
jgi:hypothetical protein